MSRLRSRVAGLLVLVLLSFFIDVGTAKLSFADTRTIPLKASQEGSTAATFGQGSCPTPVSLTSSGSLPSSNDNDIITGEPYDCWHFVVPSVSNYFVNVSGINFSSTLRVNRYIEKGKPNHAWVYTQPLGAVLLQSEAVINGSADDFVLSHTTKGVPNPGNITPTVTTLVSESGNSFKDVATVKYGANSPVTVGSVSFYVCPEAIYISSGYKCPTEYKFGEPVNLNSQGKAESDLYSTNEPGTYYFYAYYNGATGFDARGDEGGLVERFVVPTFPTDPLDPTITTEVQERPNNNDAKVEIFTGEKVVDVATITLRAPSTAGEVIFYLCQKANNFPIRCSSGGVEFDRQNVGGRTSCTPSNVCTITVTSKEFTPDIPGYYLFYAEYVVGGVVKARESGSNPNRNSREQFEVKSKNEPTPNTNTTTPTPSPTTTSSPTPTPTPSPTSSARPTPTPSRTPTPTPSENVVDAGACEPVTIKLNIPTGSIVRVAKLPSNGTISLANPTTILYTPTNCGSISIDFDEFELRWSDSKGNSGVINKLILRKSEGDVPRLIKSGFVSKKAACPASDIDGPTIGKIVVGNVSVNVKSVSYPKGGILIPPSPLNAGLSTLHSPLNSEVGTSLITWHVNYNGCQGKLNVINNKSPGFRFTVIDEEGEKKTYRITEKFSVNKGDYKASWFSTSGQRRLLLVTCTGRVVKGSYLKNLIIFAEPVK